MCQSADENSKKKRKIAVIYIPCVSIFRVYLFIFVLFYLSVKKNNFQLFSSYPSNIIEDLNKNKTDIKSIK